MQAIHEKQTCKFGYKLWVAATPLGYAIQFYLYQRKDNFFDPDLRLGGSAVDKFMVSLPKHAGSNYQREEREGERGREREREGERKREKEGKRGRERVNEGEGERERQRQGRGRGRENAPLKPIKDMKKLERGSTDVLIDDNAKIALVRCKNNKVVTVLSSNYGLNPTAKTKRYIKERKVESILSNLNAIKKQHRNGRG